MSEKYCKCENPIQNWDTCVNCMKIIPERPVRVNRILIIQKVLESRYGGFKHEDAIAINKALAEFDDRVVDNNKTIRKPNKRKKN
jgi:hypothetical protein